MLVDVVLGFTGLDGYVRAKDIYMGSICGRYANRISGGEFTLADEVYSLQKNNEENTLHGGVNGFDKKFWKSGILKSKDGIIFTCTSKNQEEGFPGNLIIEVTYRILNKALHIEYTAKTDKPTPINLTSHCYFNLSGGNDKNIFYHELMLNADHYLEVNKSFIPTGKILETKNSSYDFKAFKLIGNLSLHPLNFDHSWVVNKAENELDTVAVIRHARTGIQMNVSSTEPSVHFYTGNFLNKDLILTKQRDGYDKYAGLCLEAQHYPDSPNQPTFPNTILKPGEEYSQKTIYAFTSN